MIDLRNTQDKKLIKAANRFRSLDIKTNPESNKHKNFHFALSDYILRELRKRGVKVSKLNDLALRIHIGEPEFFKYHSLVIDCLEGAIYAINNQNKERKIGKLVNFEGKRASDAFHCMKKSIYKILRKINVYSMDHEGNVIEQQFKKTASKDLRRFIRHDLRKKIISRVDLRKKVSSSRVDLRGLKKMNKFETAVAVYFDLREARKEIACLNNTNKKSFSDITKSIVEAGKNIFKKIFK